MFDQFSDPTLTLQGKLWCPKDIQFDKVVLFC